MTLLLSSLFFALKDLVNNSRESRAYERTNDEYPENAHGSRVALHKSDKSGTEAARGVDRCACEADAEDVYEGERKTDHKSAEGAVTRLL